MLSLPEVAARDHGRAMAIINPSKISCSNGRILFSMYALLSLKTLLLQACVGSRDEGGYIRLTETKCI